MRIRAITALFFVIVMVASMLLGSYVFAGFFILLSAYCADEFYRIIGDDSRPNRLLGLLLGTLGFGLFAAYRLAGVDARYLLLLVPLAAATFIIPLYQKHEKPFGAIAYTLLGVGYVVLPFIAFFSLGFITGAFDYRLPLGFMLILWGNDTGAYLVGKFFGKRRLFERISPNKTWEGFMGGVLLAVVISLVLAHCFTILAGW